MTIKKSNLKCESCGVEQMNGILDIFEISYGTDTTIVKCNYCLIKVFEK